MSRTYQTFAERHHLTPTEAMVLPALFEKVAEQTSLSKQGAIDAAHYNTKAGDYLAETARIVARSLEAENENQPTA